MISHFHTPLIVTRMDYVAQRHKVRHRKFYIALVVAAVLAGCGENTPVQTVDWYKDHDTERKEMITKCNNNPGEFEESPNCVNAQTAQDRKDAARRGWPKLDFEKKEK